MSIIDAIRNLLNENPFSGHYKVNRMRPPGSVDEKRFMKLCVRCSRCVEVCPYGALKRSTKTEYGEIGTPFIYAEEAGCHLCMKCTSVCPTGAIDPNVTEMTQTFIGIARINEDTCNNFIYDRQESGEDPDGMAAICSSCFNVCPLQFDAIRLENGLIPIITDQCTGCGMCVERCPTRPRSISIIPKDMPDADTAGYFHYLKRIDKK